MTTPSPAQAIRYAEKLVARAWAITLDAEDEEARKAFVMATFNIDWCAAAIVALAHMEPMEKPPE